MSNKSSDQDCDARSLDLRQPPTRDDVGMPQGERSVDWSCDDGFSLTVKLPDDRTLELEARALSLSTYGVDADTNEPQGVDIHSTWLSVDDAVKLANRLADAFGMDPAPIETWSDEAQSPPDPTVDTKTRFIPGTAGYVQADLQVVHQNVSGDNTVHLIMRVRD